jgi:hypothetical protein
MDSGDRNDQTGIPIDELHPISIVAMRKLIHLDLVEVCVGWRGTVWFSLTERGHRLRDDGFV